MMIQITEEPGKEHTPCYKCLLFGLCNSRLNEYYGKMYKTYETLDHKILDRSRMNAVLALSFLRRSCSLIDTYMGIDQRREQYIFREKCLMIMYNLVGYVQDNSKE